VSPRDLHCAELHYESMSVKEEDVIADSVIHQLPRRVHVGAYFSDYLFEADTVDDEVCNACAGILDMCVDVGRAVRARWRSRVRSAH
jgi:hypothetical protein